MMDEMAAAMQPHGLPTRFEPLGQSLEQLLGGGWKRQQASGEQGGMTLLLTNSSSNAVCILVPKTMGESSSALSDWRKLN